jgi:hypothetical protein
MEIVNGEFPLPGYKTNLKDCLQNHHIYEKDSTSQFRNYYIAFDEK